MCVVGVVSWIVTGVLWIANGVVYRSGPAYSHPATLIDYLAISLFSGGLLATAVALWTLREMTHDRVGAFGANAAIVGVAGGALAGVADIGEDGFAIAALGGLFLTGMLLLAIGSIAFGLAIATINGPWRAAAVPPLVTIVAFAAGDSGGGHFITGAAWLALGLAAVLTKASQR